MRAIVQRVTAASVRVGGEVVGAIDHGLCVLVGVTHADTEAEADRLAAKLRKLRVFDDEAGVMNRSVSDVGGSVLVVSQFTVYGDTRRGNRPSWLAAAGPDVAEGLVARVVETLTAAGVPVSTGRFRTDMQVEIHNDGPITVIVDVDNPGSVQTT